MADETPDSNNPKIPSFKPTRKSGDDKKGGGGPLSNLGKSPGSSTTGSGGSNPLSSLGKPSGLGTKTPSGGFNFPGFSGQKGSGMKIRGLGGAGGSLLDRLKNLRRKDLMFIGAGLATLMMAPVAEHFMMTPDDRVGGDLVQQFDSKGPLFPDGSTVYESGTGGFSPGGLVGAGTDVITPLNVRDPSALVMGPGAKQKPEAVIPPPVARSSSSKDDGGASKWKDALADSAKAGVRAAVKKSPKLPRPSVKMQGALRGLSALSGASKGGGPSFKLPALSASKVPNSARGSSSLTRSQAVPGFRGAGRRSNASGTGLEGLRGAAGRQADIFSRAGAAGGLETAANVALPFPGDGGFGGFGGPGGGGGGVKNPGGNQIKENKQLGESLAFLRRKMEQEKAIGLKWKKKEWNQFGRKKAIQEGAIKLMFDSFGKIVVDPISGIFKKLGDQLAEPGGGAPGGVYCNAGSPSRKLTNPSGHYWQCKTSGMAQLIKKESHASVREQECLACAGFDGSTETSGGGGENENEDAEVEDRVGRPADGAASGMTIDKICQLLKDPAIADSGIEPFKELKGHLLAASQKIMGTRNSLFFYEQDQNCGSSKYFNPHGRNTVNDQLNIVELMMLGRDAGRKTGQLQADALAVIKAGVEHVTAIETEVVVEKLGEGKRTLVNFTEMKAWRYNTEDRNKLIIEAHKSMQASSEIYDDIKKIFDDAQGVHEPIAEALKTMDTEMAKALNTDISKARLALTATLAHPDFRDPEQIAMANNFFSDVNTFHTTWQAKLVEKNKHSTKIGGDGTNYAANGAEDSHAIANGREAINNTLTSIDAVHNSLGNPDGSKVETAYRVAGVAEVAAGLEGPEKWASGYGAVLGATVQLPHPEGLEGTMIVDGKDNDATDPGVQAMGKVYEVVKPEVAAEYRNAINPATENTPFQRSNKIYEATWAVFVEKVPSANPPGAS